MSDEKAVAGEAPTEEKEAKKGAYTAKDKVVLHGRFQPDGTVTQLGGCPDGVTAQQWFNFLTEKAADAYKTLSGARIVFTLTPDRLNGLQAGCKAA